MNFRCILFSELGVEVSNLAERDPVSRDDDKFIEIESRRVSPHWALGQNREMCPLLATSHHQMVIV
jgi:hypothetical protein